MDWTFIVVSISKRCTKWHLHDTREVNALMFLRKSAMFTEDCPCASCIALSKRCLTCRTLRTPLAM